jgi:hypothetical protein
MNKIKILYLIDKLGYGGAQRHLIELLGNIDRTVFEPYVCCLLTGGKLLKELEDLKINYKI